MADEADITAERDEAEYSLRLAASRRPAGPKPTGACHWCASPVADLLRYCDVDCRDDHERQLRAASQRPV